MSFIDADDHISFIGVNNETLSDRTHMEITTDPAVPFTRPSQCHRADITFIEGDENTAPLIGTVLVDSSQTFYTACIMFQGNDARAAEVLVQGLWKDKVDQFPSASALPDDFTIAEPYSPIYTYIDASEQNSTADTPVTLFTILQPVELEQGLIDKLPLAIALATYGEDDPVVYASANDVCLSSADANDEVDLKMFFSNAALSRPDATLAIFDINTTGLPGFNGSGQFGGKYSDSEGNITVTFHPTPHLP